MAVQFDANLPGTSATCAIFYRKCLTWKCMTLRMKVTVMEYNILNGTIR